VSSRFQPADHGQHSRAEDGPTEFPNVRQNNVAISIEIPTKAMFGDMYGQIEQFDVLHNFEIVGGRQLAFAYVRVIDFIGNVFVNTFRRQRFPHLFCVSLLRSPRFAFLRRSVFFAGGLTMSLEGDFDEFDESFVAFASLSFKSATRFVNSATVCRSFAMMSCLLTIHEQY
jgi:hypothetical protein